MRIQMKFSNQIIFSRRGIYLWDGLYIINQVLGNFIS